MKRTFVICRTMRDFQNWRESINYAIPNHECVVVCTDVPRSSDRLRGFQINETTGHQVVRWGEYDQGPYWHEVEDQLAFATRD